jgi:hypothetical protein
MPSYKKKTIPKTSRRKTVKVPVTKKSPTQKRKSPVTKKATTTRKKSPVTKKPTTTRKSRTIKKGPRVSNKAKISYQYPIDYIAPKEPEKYQEINTYVSGLNHFIVLYSLKYNKIVYLLGETHMYEGCSLTSQPMINANQFFFNLMNSTQKFLDIFLEIGLSPEDKSVYKFDILTKKYSNLERKGVGFLEKTLQDLSKANCGVNIYSENRNFKKCNYKNARVHSADIRYSKHIFSTYIGNLIQFLLYCIQYPLKPADECKRLQNIDKDFLQDQTILKHINNFFTDVKIKRQIDNIKYPEVVDFIMKKYRDLLNNVYLINYNYVREVVKITDFNEKYKLIKEIVDYISNYMDLYLFPRIFRSFRNIPGVYSEDPKNIIIYGGSFHTGEYFKWLKELEFNVVYSAYDKKEHNCVQIKNFTPIFLT